MVQILGFGLSVNDFMTLVAVFFIVAALSGAVVTRNVFFFYESVLNPVFFNGASLDNPTCADAFSGFPTGFDSFKPVGNIFVDFIITIGNFLAFLFGFLLGILKFLYGLIFGCGLSMIRLIIGWGIIVSLVFPLYKLRHMRN